MCFWHNAVGVWPSECLGPSDAPLESLPKEPHIIPQGVINIGVSVIVGCYCSFVHIGLLFHPDVCNLLYTRLS